LIADTAGKAPGGLEEVCMSFFSKPNPHVQREQDELERNAPLDRNLELFLGLKSFPPSSARQGPSRSMNSCQSVVGSSQPVVSRLPDDVYCLVQF
jgi:hypothetical protein